MEKTCCGNCYFSGGEPFCNHVAGENFSWTTEITENYVCPNYISPRWTKLLFWCARFIGVPMIQIKHAYEDLYYYVDMKSVVWIATSRWSLFRRYKADVSLIELLRGED